MPAWKNIDVMVKSHESIVRNDKVIKKKLSLDSW